MDELANAAGVGGFRGSEVEWLFVGGRDQRGGINGVGGIAEEIEAGGRRCAGTAKDYGSCTTTDVERVELVEREGVAIDFDGARAADVEDTQFPSLEEC